MKDRPSNLIITFLLALAAAFGFFIIGRLLINLEKQIEPDPEVSLQLPATPKIENPTDSNKLITS